MRAPASVGWWALLTVWVNSVADDWNIFVSSVKHREDSVVVQAWNTKPYLQGVEANNVNMCGWPGNKD